MTDIAMTLTETESLRRHGWAGLGSIAVILGGFTYWSAVTPISGAVVAGGSVVVDGGGRRVQHQEGGIVKDILVENEDVVAAGQVLVRLDGTSTAANLAVITAQLGEAYVRQARLLAESTGTGEMTWPAALDGLPETDRFRALFAAEDHLRRNRIATLDNQTAQLSEQIGQLQIQIEGLKAQHDAVTREIEIVAGQAKTLTGLLSRSLVEGTRVAEIQREATRLDGDKARIEAEIARTGATVAERRLQITQLGDSFRTEVLGELQKVSLSIAELLQQKIAAEDRLSRLDIRASIPGAVHESVIQTVGGVVGAGETLMKIIPQDGKLMVDVRVSPLDIDKLSPGQRVTLRLSSFDPRATPELEADVTRISPDLSRDPANGAQFYVVRVGVPEHELSRLPKDMHVVPGMPVEAFFTTGDRTVLSFLVKPITNQLSLVFRED